MVGLWLWRDNRDEADVVYPGAALGTSDDL